MDVNSRDPSQNIIPFRITGIEAARFDKNGNLGIGTTNPSAKLDISGNVNVVGNVSVYNTPSSNNHVTNKAYVDTKFNNVPTPSNNNDAANKAYVDTKTTDMATTTYVAGSSWTNNPTVTDSGNTNATYRLVYTQQANSRANLYNDGQLYYNPSTDTLISTFFYGNLKGVIYSDIGNATGFFTQGDTITPSRWDMHIYNGKVGIGSSGAAAPLHVFGSASNTITGTGRYWDLYAGTSTASGTTWAISIITENSIWNKGQHNWLTSDQRIKTNIVNLNADKMMNVFRNLRPISFDYIDTMKNNNKKHFGFIAQEINEIIPEGISLNTDVIPNNMMKGKIDQRSKIEASFTLKPDDTDISLNYLLLKTDTSVKFDTANTYSSTNVYKFKVSCGEKWSKEQDIYICSEYNVIDDKYSYVIGMKKDVYDIVITEPTLFVYGQYVYDLHILDHDTIYTVATAALQEVDRQQQADKVRIAELEATVANQQSIINDILERLKKVGA